MNLNAMKALCNGGKRATVLNGQLGSQWICNGFGAWLVEGITIEDAFALEELFGLTRKQRLTMNMRETTVSDTRFRINPVDGEEDSYELGAVMWGDGSDSDVYIALKSEYGALWIPYNAVKHIKADARRYAVRWQYGRPLVAVYGDLLCSVLIMPLNNVYAEAMRRMAGDMATAAYHWPDDEADAAAAEAAAEALLNDDHVPGDD